MNERLILQLYRQGVKLVISTENEMNFTRNLSVFIIAGMMYFIFAFPETSSHLIAIIGSLTIFLLQIFEARIFENNYTYTKRVKLIEQVFAICKTNDSVKLDSNILNNIIENSPRINFLYSFAAVTWKNYILIFFTLDVCWFAKLYLFPYPATSWNEFFKRPESGFIPGWFFFLFAGAFWLIYFSLGIWYKIKSRNEK